MLLPIMFQARIFPLKDLAASLILAKVLFGFQAAVLLSNVPSTRSATSASIFDAWSYEPHVATQVSPPMLSREFRITIRTVNYF